MQSCSLHQPPSDASFGYSDLPVLPPHVLNNISGGDSAEDPAASPSLLDERVENVNCVAKSFRWDLIELLNLGGHFCLQSTTVATNYLSVGPGSTHLPG